MAFLVIWARLGSPALSFSRSASYCMWLGSNRPVDEECSDRRSSETRIRVIVCAIQQK